MDMQQAIHRALSLNEARPTRLGHWHYLRFADGCHPITRGTTVFQEEVIWGYPEIGRILRLATGLREYFQAPFWVEEKVDGYNVRIFKHGETVLALTRRGYICPFTTDRLPDLLDTRIFAEQPDIVLCAEVAGPENPYNEGYPPYVTEDVRLFVFDVLRKNTSCFLPHAERMQLLQAYGLPSVTQYGKHQASDLETLKTLLLRLDAEGKEGVVFKEDSVRDQRAKYVTGHTNLRDLRVTAMNFLQLPPEYYTQRVMRLVLFLEEAGLTGSPALYADLGEALIEGVFQAIRQYQQHQKVFHTFRCRFRRQANALLFMQSQRRLLGAAHVRQRRLHKVGDFYHLEFDKVMPRETSLLRHILQGGLAFD
jgi:putative ATP-dependent DNA ligase